MFRALAWTLRQRRYAALAVAGLVVALISAGMGTFEIHRYHDKVHDNRALRDNAHARLAPLTTALVPLTGHGRAPSTTAVQYRPVSVRGRYVVGQQQYVANQSHGGQQGFYVLTPLRSGSATVLVVRGFVAATSAGNRPARVAAPPAGLVSVTGWLQAAQDGPDQFGHVGHREIVSVNPAEQATRLGTPVYQASLVLTARQPGTAGLTALSRPSLGNPSGGAAQWQLLSYVVQWYVFALLGLALPFLVSRAEVRNARRRFLGIDPGAEQIDAGADRREVAGAGSSDGQLVPRARGELAVRAGQAQRLERSARLADRYGRSLGPDVEAALATSPDLAADGQSAAVRDSSTAVHRSADAYHADYNDYLWRLAMADGGVPDLFGDGEPRRIDVATDEDDEAAPGFSPPVS